MIGPGCYQCLTLREGKSLQMALSDHSRHLGEVPSTPNRSRNQKATDSRSVTVTTFTTEDNFKTATWLIGDYDLGNNIFITTSNILVKFEF
jgi:hypothetical protein